MPDHVTTSSTERHPERVLRLPAQPARQEQTRQIRAHRQRNHGCQDEQRHCSASQTVVCPDKPAIAGQHSSLRPRRAGPFLQALARRDRLGEKPRPKRVKPVLNLRESNTLDHPCGYEHVVPENLLRRHALEKHPDPERNHHVAL